MNADDFCFKTKIECVHSFMQKMNQKKYEKMHQRILSEDTFRRFYQKMHQQLQERVSL